MSGGAFGRPASLCWRCVNAVPSDDGLRGCSWSRRFVPVEGWHAERNDLKTVRLGVVTVCESYFVHGCPKFKEG